MTPSYEVFYFQHLLGHRHLSCKSYLIYRSFNITNAKPLHWTWSWGSSKKTVIWDAATRGPEETDWHIWDAYCNDRPDDEAVAPLKYQSTKCNIPEESHLHSRYHENLKSRLSQFHPPPIFTTYFPTIYRLISSSSQWLLHKRFPMLSLILAICLIYPGNMHRL